MFRVATALARTFTRPVVVSFRERGGRVGSGVGTYVVANDAGWIVTSAHIFEVATRAARARAGTGQDQVIAHSLWWGRDGVGLVDLKVLPEVDLAVGRLEPFPAGFVDGYPVFKDPTTGIEPGVSLCRMGFPFPDVRTTYDVDTGHFTMVDPKLVFFPNEGIMTRLIDAGRTRDGAHPILSIETSSPGLKGQSGGPVYDRDGRVWGIQSRTTHIPLGFDPTITIEGKQVVEHQFLNLGVAVHVATVISVLSSLGVAHQVSQD
jgi:Trypsin-like peptidase domain